MVELLGRFLSVAITRKIPFGAVTSVDNQSTDQLPFVVNFHRTPINGESALSIKAQGKIITIHRAAPDKDHVVIIGHRFFAGQSIGYTNIKDPHSYLIPPGLAVEEVMKWAQTKNQDVQRDHQPQEDNC